MERIQTYRHSRARPPTVRRFPWQTRSGGALYGLDSFFNGQLSRLSASVGSSTRSCPTTSSSACCKRNVSAITGSLRGLTRESRVKHPWRRPHHCDWRERFRDYGLDGRYGSGVHTHAEGIERLERSSASWEGSALSWRLVAFHGRRYGCESAGIRMFDYAGDLEETAFLVEGLLTARAYLSQSDTEESPLFRRISGLWETVEWD